MSTFHQIESPNLLVDGTITVLLRNGKHFTYRVHTVKKGDLEGKRIVALLNGPDNNSNYKGFGFVVPERANVAANGQHPNWVDVPDSQDIAIWKKCRSEAFEKHAKLLLGHANEHVVEWMQEGRCMKCGRKLTTPESLKAGIGPVCAGRA